jgi:hypothetical protein
MPNDANLSLLQATIASFRYWVPAVSDVARVAENEIDGVWRMAVTPLQAGACPFGVMLSRDGTFALTVNGVAYPEEPAETLDMFLPLAEAIVDGNVVQRHWSSANTGIPTRIESQVDAGRHAWRGMLTLPAAAVVPSDAEIVQDRHFLPYRRR